MSFVAGLSTAERIALAANKITLFNEGVKDVKMGYRYGKRMYRRYKKRYQRRYAGAKRRFKAAIHPSKRRRVGEPVGYGTTKRFTTIDLEPATRTSRRLFVREMTQIPQVDATVDQIDQRQRSMVNLRGFKICMELKNNGGTPLLFNMAVVSPKGQNVNLTQNPLLTIGDAVEDNWFRGNGNTRSIAFDGGSLNSNDFHCRPINTDEYNVLMHKRINLNTFPAATTWENQRGSNYKFIMKYVPIKRQIRFDTNARDSCASGKIFFVYWYDNFQQPIGASATDSLIVSERYITYFKEPKN